MFDETEELRILRQTVHRAAKEKIANILVEGGSRLFSESSDIQLEGKAGRFPMEVADFSDPQMAFIRSPQAYWYFV